MVIELWFLIPKALNFLLQHYIYVVKEQPDTKGRRGEERRGRSLSDGTKSLRIDSY